MFNPAALSPSFVPFTASRLAAPRVFWRRDEQQLDAFLLQFAYCNPLPGDNTAAFLPESKVFHSDRYGGKGMLSNGGGARCGSTAGMQIKGIGKTPLAGEKTPFWHSYGGESIAGGVRDAIWGEVCNRALPFGAVRVAGVISTGTTVPAFTAPGATVGSEARGLTLRPFALRPGHFVRALQFSRRDEERAGIGTDAERTRNAVGHAPAIFSALLGCSGAGLSKTLPLMVARFAAQLAAANAKRIVHGAMSASNICIDGKWIDFGTASTVSDYGKIKVGDGLPDAWDLDDSHKVIRDLCFYLMRYLPDQDRRELPPPAILLKFFDNVLAERRMREFLKLTGISESILSRLPKSELDTLYKVILKVRDSGNREPFQLYAGRDRAAVQMPAVMGHFHLPTIFIEMALSFDENSCESALRPVLAEAGLRSAITQAYWKVRRSYMSAVPEQEKDQRVEFMQWNSIRRNAMFPELYRHELDIAIDRVLAQGEPVTAFIETIVAKAEVLFSDKDDSVLSLSGWFGSAVELCPARGLISSGNQVSRQALVEVIPTSILSQSQQLRWVNNA